MSRFLSASSGCAVVSAALAVTGILAPDAHAQGCVTWDQVESKDPQPVAV